MAATAVREGPILFKGRLVRAILEDRKWQTRRVIKPQTTSGPHQIEDLVTSKDALAAFIRHKSPYGKKGDRLYVRETWAGCCGRYAYQADGKVVGGFKKSWLPTTRWRPSIHMPKRLSRITLEVTRIRVERIQQITEADAKAEGVQIPVTSEGCPEGKVKMLVRVGTPYRTDYWNARHAYRAEFAYLWDSINKRRGYGWEKNPWVWVVDFRRIKP